MKKIILLSFLIAFAFGVHAQCCNKSASEKISKSSCNVTDATKSASVVTAYYFHATRRCETCQAVEAVSKEAIQEYYGDKVQFLSVNNEEEGNRQLVEKYQVSGQTLLIVKGDKIIDLTTDAFLNARTKPDKLKAKIKTTIDALI